MSYGVKSETEFMRAYEQKVAISIDRHVEESLVAEQVLLTADRIVNEHPSLVRDHPEVAEYFEPYVEVVGRLSPLLFHPPTIETEPSIANALDLFGNPVSEESDGLLAENNLVAIILAEKGLQHTERTYQDPDILFFERQGAGHSYNTCMTNSGSYLLKIAGVETDLNSGKPDLTKLVSTTDRPLFLTSIAEAIQNRGARIVLATKELAGSVVNEDFTTYPYKKPELSDYSGACGSCTRFTCRHGSFKD